MSAPVDGAARKPRRWLAVVLSLLSSGLGQAYAGFPLRGLAIVVGMYLALAPLALFVTARPTLASLAATFAAAAGGCSIRPSCGACSGTRRAGTGSA
jgi:hypothetical protein